VIAGCIVYKTVYDNIPMVYDPTRNDWYFVHPSQEKKIAAYHGEDCLFEAEGGKARITHIVKHTPKGVEKEEF
jgi:hypothetical protein